MQIMDLERLETTIRDHRGSGGLVGIGGLGDNNNREGDKVEGTYFVLLENSVKRGLKR